MRYLKCGLLRLAIISCMVCFGVGIMAGNLKVASLFQDKMVLQHDMVVNIWGRAEPGSKVIVNIGNGSGEVLADEDGKWFIELPPLKASFKSETIVVSCKDERIEIKDVLVGEVWVVSGQSNMDMSWHGLKDVKKMIESGKRVIRSFNVDKSIAFEPRSYMNGKWESQVPDSAVAAVYACKLYDDLNVPVGIVQTAWGSSSLECWMPAELTGKLPYFQKIMKRFRANEKQQNLCKLIIEYYRKHGSLQGLNEDEVIRGVSGFLRGNPNLFAKTRPNLLFNAMMHPLIPYSVRGMVWYQGEANTKTIQKIINYKRGLPVWIEALRNYWHEPDMGFIIVMLPRFKRLCKSIKNYTMKGDLLREPNVCSWAFMRNIQLDAMKNLNRVYTVNTIDLGERDCIHPKDKMPVGLRAALIAEKEIYGKSTHAFGPLFKSFKRVGDQIIISFDNGEGLKTTDGEPVRSFFLSESGSRKWIEVPGKIDGDKIILTLPSSEMKNILIRYAFSAFPNVNLVNKYDMPAYPFRTGTGIPY